MVHPGTTPVSVCTSSKHSIRLELTRSAQQFRGHSPVGIFICTGGPTLPPTSLRGFADAHHFTIDLNKGHTMLVGERMKAAVWLAPDDTLAAAARLLRQDNIGCLPVCQDGRVIGMITDRDIAMRGVADDRDPNQMKVREAMSVDVICCSKKDTLETAVAIMRAAHVQRLAVTKGDGHLVGIISMSDAGGASSGRRPFEVVFYKEILDHAGMPHHSELMRISVAQGTKQEAVEAAIAQFQEANRVTNWTALASGYDVSSIHVDADGANVEVLECTSERDARIRPRARILWEQAGTPEGQDIQFWERAAGETDAEYLPEK
jgi:hypothetical protein